MAEGLSRSESVAPAPLTAGASSPHADKFRLATAALIGVAVGAVVIAIAIAVSGSSRPAPAARWSAWAPVQSGTTGATEIAEHVAPLYRLTAADQMDVVTRINVTGQNDAGATTGSGLTVAVGSDNASADESLSLLSGTTIAYNICGIGGSDCSLPGTASTPRLLLLRREALELALYTFKYVRGAENVLAVLPPGTSSTETTAPLSATRPSSTAGSIVQTTRLTVAVLFIRSELQPWLAAPLADTLAQYPPLVSQLTAWAKTNEAGLVDQITERGLFSEKIESQQDGGNLLVLNPLPPE